MKIEVDEFGELLWIEGEEFYSHGDNNRFEVLYSLLKDAKLSDIPQGVSIKPCSRVVGGHELFGIGPAWFEHTRDGSLLARVEHVFFLDEETLDESEVQHYLLSQLAIGKSALEPLSKDGSVVELTESVDREEGTAYLDYSIRLPDQLIYDAESFVDAIETRIHSVLASRVLFICHASEDKPFVERLVGELDRRALHAWFDQREILVGDSIVEKINEGLSQARYIIAVLSPHSVQKPWPATELRSSLMRQVETGEVVLLPALLESCDIPAIIADLKYADFRASFDHGFAALLASIRQRGH